MSNYWQERFEKTGADGVQFVGLCDTPWNIRTSYGCRTREEMLAGCAYPRSGYLLYKMVNGQKEYIIDDRFKRKPGSVDHHPERKIMYMIVDEDEINWGAFDNRQDAEEIAMALYEELAYEVACDLYTWHHHWDMERAAREAWKRVGWEYQIKEFDFWKF